MIQEEVGRMADADSQVRPLSILDSRGGEIRWESERFPQYEDPRSAQLSEMADRFIENMERENE